MNHAKNSTEINMNHDEKLTGIKKLILKNVPRCMSACQSDGKRIEAEIHSQRAVNYGFRVLDELFLAYNMMRTDVFCSDMKYLLTSCPQIYGDFHVGSLSLSES